MSDYQLWHGDCLQEMNRIEDSSIDCVICDLPYGTTSCVWDTRIPFEPLWKQYKRILRPRGACVLFGSQPFTSMLVMSNLEWFKYEIIWKKTRPSGFLHAENKPLKVHENILVFSPGSTVHKNQSNNRMDYNPQKSNGKPYLKRSDPKVNLVWSNMIRPSTNKVYTTLNVGDRYPITVIEFSNDNHSSEHNTQKPVSLLRYLIRTYTNPGDLILDNCAGSGSTLEAAMREERRSIGIELYPLPDKPIDENNPDYFGIATKRIENVARELRGEWKPMTGNGDDLSGLPLFEVER